MNLAADSIIEEIDAGSIHPTTHLVVRALHEHINLADDLQREALAAFDRGDQSADTDLQSAMWTKIRELAVEDQSGMRLSICLTRPNEAIDWYLAEYIIGWAREQGVEERQIIDAFHAPSRGG
ncbi:hypothetical protein [Sphingobium yanoikuyae]